MATGFIETVPGSFSLVPHRPPDPTCTLADTAYLKFPDGEILTAAPAGTRYVWPVEPFMTDAATAAWIELNYLSRPPLSDAEIRLMPVSEVIGFYYSLRRIKIPCGVTPDPIVSAGLGRLGIQHELNIQQRIFNLRPELHSITLGGKTYRVLCPPRLLDPPSCPNSGLGMGIGGIIADIVAYSIPIVGWVYAAASIAYTTYDTIQTLKAAGRATDLINEIQAGMTYAKQLVHDPVPDAQLINTLKDSAARWQARLAQVTPYASQVNNQAIHSCNAITALLNGIGGSGGGVANYAASWRPFQRYFFSKSVFDLCYPAQQQPITSAVIAPSAAGLGLGALLLLLL